MTQGFTEWFYKQLGDRDETQPPFKIAKMWAVGAYGAGAASRQAEVDELQKRIDEALNMLCKLQYSSGDRIYNDVGNILKGK